MPDAFGGWTPSWTPAKTTPAKPTAGQAGWQPPASITKASTPAPMPTQNPVGSAINTFWGAATTWAGNMFNQVKAAQPAQYSRVGLPNQQGAVPGYQAIPAIIQQGQANLQAKVAQANGRYPGYVVPQPQVAPSQPWTQFNIPSSMPKPTSTVFPDTYKGQVLSATDRGYYGNMNTTLLPDTYAGMKQRQMDQLDAANNPPAPPLGTPDPNAGGYGNGWNDWGGGGGGSADRVGQWYMNMMSWNINRPGGV